MPAIVSKKMYEYKIGQKVRVNRDEMIKRSIKDYDDWVGEIISISHTNKCLRTKTLFPSKTKWDELGSQMSWSFGVVEPIEEEYKLEIPENKTACSKCDSYDCKGLARIECLTS